MIDKRTDRIDEVRRQPVLVPQDSVAFGLEFMRRTGEASLPVVGRDGPEPVLGVVSRERLAAQCAEAGHDTERCTVEKHLRTDVALITEGEFRTERRAIENTPRPVIVLDGVGRPLMSVAERAAYGASELRAI